MLFDAYDSWDNAWEAKVTGGMGKVTKRIHKTNIVGDSKLLWDVIRKVVNNPMSNKEVWLFLGNFLSKRFFENELSRSKPKPHVIQAAYLLNATMTECASVGVKLKIFCK